MTGDFIEVYDNALDARTCAALIARFEASGQATRGAVGSGVNTDLKDSWDIGITADSAWSDAVNALNAAMATCLKRYVRTYPHCLLAPMTLHMKDPAGGKPVLLTAERLAQLNDTLLSALITKVFRPGAINLQKYLADQGGYPYWHCEFYPKAGSGDTLHRVLLWSIYLNDGFHTGETEFLHQQRRITPRAGSLLIAPAGFTHTHRGNRPQGGDKYIATSWVLYQHAETLYAQH